MNEFRIFFQLFLIIVFFSGIYVIFWLDRYHETFDNSIDSSVTTPSKETPVDNLDEQMYFSSPDGTIKITITNGATIVTSPDGTLTTMTSSDNSIIVTNDNGIITVSNTNDINSNPDGSISINDASNTINIDIVNSDVSQGNAAITNNEKGGTTITDDDGTITIVTDNTSSMFTSTPGGIVFPEPIFKELPDGTKVYEYPDGTTTTETPDGTTITETPEGITITELPDGTKVYRYSDGTTITESPDGTKVDESPDGTISTESPDGTISTESPDGTVKMQDTTPYNISNLLTTLAPISAIVKNAVTDYNFPTTFASNPEGDSQNLDDYILNNNPVDVKPQSTINDDGQFLPATMAYPNSQYSPFDPLNEDINHYEYVAKEFTSSQPDGLSDNPMDPNWGGVMYTQNMIKSGKYVDNNVNKPLLFQPKGIFIDNIPSAFGKPKDIY